MVLAVVGWGLAGSASPASATHQAMLHPFPGAQLTQDYADYNVDGPGYHTGVDLAKAGEPPVHAAADGVVTEAVSSCAPGDTGCGSGFGNHVIFRHTLADGRTIYTVYGHLSSVSVGVGACVAAGDRVGNQGETGNVTGGPHLHFELKDSPGLGPEYGYSPTHPDNYGYFDPFAYIGVVAYQDVCGGSTDADSHTVITDLQGRTWLAALKKTGTLYTRTYDPVSGWQGFVKHGSDESWSPNASASLEVDTTGRVWLFAVKKTGTLYHRYFNGSVWSSLFQQGAAESWSTNAGASVTALPDGGLMFSAVKKTGTLYTRSYDPVSGWQGFVQQGADGSWAA